MDFFHFIYNEEIRERAFSYLLSLCDSAEMLCVEYNDEESDLEIDVLGTEYEYLITAIKARKKGESWGMWGTIYKFALTDELKSLIMREGLSAMPQILSGVRLENLTLLKCDKVMYATCSHEGYEHFDEDFKKNAENFCRTQIVNTKLYAETLERYKKLPVRTRNERAVIRGKLYDLSAQVEDAWQKWLRVKPLFKMSFAEYLRLAKPVLSADIYAKLAKAGSFKGLNPEGFPRTVEELKAFKGVFNFCETELVREIKKQLDMLETVFYIKEGFDDWHIDGEEKQMPSLIINRIEED
ncbi:MAG: hypothetical protein HFJ81_06040 [Clostridia bacterium]|nr:hypothetical protein [Clostridia bacterium]